MPTVICDAMAKLRMASAAGNFSSAEMREGMVNTNKRPSTGLDLNREYLDCRRTSYQYYVDGWTSTDDSQKLVQLKRTTEAGLQTGYVLLVGNKIQKMPNNDLANDVIMPEVLTLQQLSLLCVYTCSLTWSIMQCPPNSCPYHDYTCILTWSIMQCPPQQLSLS